MPPFVRTFGKIFRSDFRLFQFQRIRRIVCLLFGCDQAHRGILQVHQLKGFLHRGLEVFLDLVRDSPVVGHLVQQVQTPLAGLRVKRLLEVIVPVFHFPGRHIAARRFGQDVRSVAQTGPYAGVILILLPRMPYDPRVFSELQRIVDQISEEKHADQHKADIEESFMRIVMHGPFFHGRSFSG